MTRINLLIDRTTKDEELEKKIPNLKPIIRIRGGIFLKGAETAEIAIIDTGAHISLVPFRFWRDLDVEILTEHYVSGVVPGKRIPVNVGYMKGRLIDKEGNESKEIQFLAYLAFTNKVSLLLGMRDLLERFDIHINFSMNEAYLEE